MITRMIMKQKENKYLNVKNVVISGGNIRKNIMNLVTTLLIGHKNS